MCPPFYTALCFYSHCCFVTFFVGATLAGARAAARAAPTVMNWSLPQAWNCRHAGEGPLLSGIKYDSSAGGLFSQEPQQRLGGKDLKFAVKSSLRRRPESRATKDNMVYLDFGIFEKNS